MKLVDILARELKEWPDCEEIFQDYDGELRYMGNPVSTRSHCFVEMCDDLIRPKYGVDIKGITQPQWKEARDALLKADAKEWNGEGLPPVGTVCNLKYQGFDQGVVEVLFCSKQTTVCRNLEDGREQFGDTFEYEFRPIRTPGQIAADERLHKIRNAHTAIARTLDSFRGDIPAEGVSRTIIEAMIDAGYSEHEPK